MKNELQRLLRAYIFILLVLLCAFGVCAGVLEAQNNTRRMSFGESADTITWGSFLKASAEAHLKIGQKTK